MITRWWTYQKERFPVLAYGLVVAAFTFSGLSLSAALRGAPGLPSLHTFLVAFLTSLMLFAQLRIADEFKDHDDDCKYQPERPVPRGLISLRDLGWAGGIFAVLQVLLTASLSPQLLWLLALAWIYMLLMSAEFFVRDWLREHPAAYLISHMMILFFIDLYVTGCDWLVQGQGPPDGLLLFFGLSLCNGVILEIGRKMRAPEDELAGVTTYTSAWGLHNATMVWTVCVSVASVLASVTAMSVGTIAMAAPALALLLIAALFVAAKFVLTPSKRKSNRIDGYSQLWILASYLLMGVLPLLTKIR